MVCLWVETASVLKDENPEMSKEFQASVSERDLTSLFTTEPLFCLEVRNTIKYVLLFIVGLSMAYYGTAQPFTIHGYVKGVSSGKVVLWREANDAFYRSVGTRDSVLVRNHQFTIRGSMPGPELFRFYFALDERFRVSEPFWLEEGSYTIVADTVESLRDVIMSGDVVTGVDNPTQKASAGEFLGLFADSYRLVDSLAEVQMECDRDTLLENRMACGILVVQEVCEKKWLGKTQER
jgi:hypothetical protein